MAIKNNEVLGYHNCLECGDRATVHQAKRGKGRYLYKRCECGCDQRTGAKVQTTLFNSTEWVGDAPEPPPNLIKLKVSDEPKQPVIEPKPEPKAQPKDNPKEPEKEGKKPLLFVLATGTTIALLALMGRRI